MRECVGVSKCVRMSRIVRRSSRREREGSPMSVGSQRGGTSGAVAGGASAAPRQGRRSAGWWTCRQPSGCALAGGEGGWG